MLHKICIRNKFITIVENRDIVSQNVEDDLLDIEFDSEWDDMDVIAVLFTDKVRTKRVIWSGQPIIIPWECIFNPGYLWVSVVGYIGSTQKAVTKLMSHPFRVRKSGAFDCDCGCGCSPYPPEDDIQKIVKAAIDGCIEEIQEIVAQSIPIATTEVPGIVSVGEGLSIDENGRLTVTATGGGDGSGIVEAVGQEFYVDSDGALRIKFLTDEEFMSNVN